MSETAAHDEDTETPTSYETILGRAIEEGLSELQRPTDGLLLSALTAGLELGTGLFFTAIIWTFTTSVYAEPTRELLIALAYTTGYIFVILGRSELFTEHTTLAVLPVLDGQELTRELGRLWGLVCVGNLLGSALLAGFAVAIGPALGVVKPAAFIGLSKLITGHPPWLLFVGAIFTGWLMGLLAWLVQAAENDGARAFFVVIVTFGIGIAHLPHPIAGNVKILMGLFVGSVSIAAYGVFVATTVVGSMIGGATFVAVLKYSHVVRSEESGAASISELVGSDD